MFAPLLFTDRKRGRYKGSLDVLWGLQMFLTNSTFYSLFKLDDHRFFLIMLNMTKIFVGQFVFIRFIL